MEEIIEEPILPEPIMIQPPETIIQPLPEGFEYSNHGLLKNQRNLILNETDKYLIPDYPITPENLIIVKEYRQQLRDFTQNDYILPDKPTFVVFN